MGGTSAELRRLEGSVEVALSKCSLPNRSQIAFGLVMEELEFLGEMDLMVLEDLFLKARKEKGLERASWVARLTLTECLM